MENALKTLQKLNESLLRAQPRPAFEGIWYYLYLRPQWKIEIFRSDDYKGIGHDGAWRSHLADKIRKHYKLSKSRGESVENLIYSMPRGRMERISPEIFQAGQKPGHWYFWHGNDFPSGLIAEAEKRRVISEFGLNAQAAAGLVLWEVSEHERMLKEHKEELQKILGLRIPY